VHALERIIPPKMDIHMKRSCQAKKAQGKSFHWGIRLYFESLKPDQKEKRGRRQIYQALPPGDSSVGFDESNPYFAPLRVLRG